MDHEVRAMRGAGAAGDATSAGPAPRSVVRAAGALAGALILAAVCRPITDPDLWQHLRVGRALWELRAIPATNVWTWPTAGAPYDVPSWLFRVLLWPFWSGFGEHGLDAWRWLTTLGTFGLLAVAARRAARGRGDALLTLALLVWTALLWRQRSQCRPETLAAVLLAAELWLLEARRTAPRAPALGRDPAWLLVPLQMVWINLHVSYYLGLAVAGAFLLDALWRRGRGDRVGAPASLAIILSVAAAACLVNPYGVRAVLQPFDFFLHGRRELIFGVVDELQPVAWRTNLHNGLPLYLAALAGCALARWRRIAFDPAQAVLLAVLLPQALATNRFLGFLAVATAPSFARDVEELFGAPLRRALPAAHWARLALLFAPVAALEAVDLSRDSVPAGLGVAWGRPPVRACDFIARHGIRGRGYNMFWQGGYLLWRFWPERDRLPFMDIHQTGTREDRDAQVLSQRDPAAWRALDARYRFDWVMLPTHPGPTQHLLDRLDADTTRWALVFTDDAASLFVRRDGRCAAVGDSSRYAVLGAGAARAAALARAAMADTLLRARLRAELDRAVPASPWNSGTRSLRASLALMDGRWRAARDDLDRALEIEPGTETAHARLAYALLRGGEPERALVETARARRAGLDPVVAADFEREARAALRGSRGRRDPGP